MQIRISMKLCIIYLELKCNPYAQLTIGSFYLNGIYFQKNVQKAIDLFKLASRKNDSEANFNLGIIYFMNSDVTRDIRKALYYLTLSANQNFNFAQLLLGLLFYHGEHIAQDVIKGIDLLNLAAKNGIKDAYFILGYIYHKGKYIQKDLKKAIQYYKEASSFNIQYAKNNLGVIFRNVFNDKIDTNIYESIEYFKEAINQKKDILSMYNLSLIYLYDQINIDQSIELLCESLKRGFQQSIELLCVALIKKCGLEIDKIKTEIKRFINESNYLFSYIIHKIIDDNLNNEKNFQIKYDLFKCHNFIYNLQAKPVPLYIINEQIGNSKKKKNYIENLSPEFYKGFGV